MLALKSSIICPVNVRNGKGNARKEPLIGSVYGLADSMRVAGTSQARNYHSKHLVLGSCVFRLQRGYTEKLC